jgi:glycosyltransferase involved in cell wall biosynthesis
MPTANGQLKVLIIHQHFKIPQRGGAVRSYYLAKALVDRGVKAVVITAHNDPRYAKENLEGIEVHYLPVAYDNGFSFRRRVLAFWRFAFAAARLASMHRDAGLCYAISTPLTTGLAAMMIRQRYGIPYLFEVGDLWPDAPIDMGFVRNPLVKRSLFQLEKAIYRRAASVVALSTPIAHAIAKKVEGKAIHVLPNMSDTEFFSPGEKDTGLAEKFGVSKQFVISYIGAVGMANGLFYFLDCAAAAQRNGVAVCFILCGDGAMLGELKAYSQQLQLRNLTFIPFQNRDGVRDVMNVSDACFISYLPVKILETGSPNKYFDALAAGKLVVINFGGWIRDEIETAACGVYVDPDAAEDFVKRIKLFVDDPLLLKKYQHAARRLAEERYSRKELEDRFAAVVMKLGV